MKNRVMKITLGISKKMVRKSNKENKMKVFINTNEKYGTEGPYKAISKEDLADTMLETFNSWAYESDPKTAKSEIARMRAEFIAGLELKKRRCNK